MASAVGGLADIVIDGQTGILVPPNDVESLHVALRRLIEDEELRGRMGQAARERLQQEFSAEAVVPEIEQVYAQLIRGQAGW